MSQVAAAPVTQRDGSVAKRALFGAWVGFYVDLFDIFLPVLVLGPALGYFVPGSFGPTATAIVGASVFAATLLGRPLGALIFGHLADTMGRRRTTIVAVGGAGVATLILGLLPGYQQWGIAAVVCMIALRFLAGIFLGGEYTAANPLAMEAAPKEKRGLYSGLICTAYPLSYATISLITVILLSVLPSGPPDSAYSQWGWRIPFILGGLLTFTLAIYYRRYVDESEIFAKSQTKKSPILSVFSEGNLRSFLRAFVLMSGFWFALQPVAAVLPGLLAERGAGLSPRAISVALAIIYLVLAFAHPAAGAVSQRTGRRPFLIVAGGIIAVGGAFLYYLLVRVAPDNGWLAVVLMGLVTASVIAPWALLTAYLNEQFHTGVRASGYGLGYSLALIPPSFYAFYQAGLATLMPFEYTGLVLMALGGLLVVLGATWGPETKDVDFAKDVG
ncbi:MAG: MFS transporter [Streptosporangiales bacterium]|nr:MFS transporter [Streptosporangiales bacterium]